MCVEGLLFIVDADWFRNMCMRALVRQLELDVYTLVQYRVLYLTLRYSIKHSVLSRSILHVCSFLMLVLNACNVM